MNVMSLSQTEQAVPGGFRVDIRVRRSPGLSDRLAKQTAQRHVTFAKPMLGMGREIGPP